MARLMGVHKVLGLGIIAALLMAGCMGGRSTPATSPRAQVQEAPVSKDVQDLQRENSALKQEQLQNTRQIEALQKQLLTQQEEQKRFREMMSTNFDLLEQSVALTLSKSIDNGGSKQTAQMTPPAQPSKTAVAAPAPVVAPASMKSTAEEVAAPKEAAEPAKPTEANAPKAVGLTTKPWIAPVTPGANTGSMGTVSAAKPAAAKTAPVAMVPAAAMIAPAAVTDPDLTPPKNPKQLTANRAAKVLYERGFALYANRQYDQAILVYQNFLSRYPEDIYSDNAQFWIGESYLHMDKLSEAEASYRKVLKEYEHRNSLEGFKTPEAIYRLGTIYAKRSDAAKAKVYFANVSQRFPESSAGRKAQRELEGKSPTTAQSEADDAKSGG